MKKGKYIYLFFVLLHFSCKFVPYFAPNGAILNIYTDRSQIETGGDKAVITILGFTMEGAPIRDYTRILLSTTIGTIAPYVDLVDGKAVTELVSGTQRGLAKIVAQSGGAKAVELIVQVGPGDLSYLDIEAAPSHLDPGGGRSLITVHAYDIDNRPLPGILVQMITSSGYFETGGNPYHTDANGMCRDWLVTQATATVKATSGKEASITVFVDTNTKPTAKFSYSPRTPKGNEDIFFNASESTDADGYIVYYEWNFGDGTPTVSGKTVKHNFHWEGAADKTYMVTLQVTDNYGAVATTTQEVKVLLI